MPASTDQQSKPSQPKNMIRKLVLPEVKKVSTPNSGEKTTTTRSNASDQGSTPNPDQSKSGSEVKASDPDQSEDDQWRMSVEEKIKKMAKFGPNYGEDTDANKTAKDSAWNHMIQQDEEIESSYMSSMNKIQVEAMKYYENSVVEKLKPGGEFRKMMARDGCFFLQLALHILGGRDILGYPNSHPYFGKNSNPTSWIPDMFFVGNQIPSIVIESSMMQPFFQEAIQKGVLKGTWKRPDHDLEKLALYLMVVEPHLEKQEPNKFLPPGLPRYLPFRKEPPPDFRGDPPSDVLQALHHLLLGSRSDNDPTYSEMKEFHDLEAGTEGKEFKIPSAWELQKQGIQLIRGELGITKIRFENWGYSAFLHVPPFAINAHSEQLLTSLAGHELTLNESQRELTAYFRFMRDLARTYKDFKILERKGIISVENDRLKGTMVYMLDTLVRRHNSNYTLNFRQIRRKINDYGGPPWRLISFCLGVLAVVQTIFTVLSYFIPRK